MTEERKKIVITAAALCLLFIAAVIGIWLYMNRFDPVEYVQAVLDASYKNQTEAYVEITGASEEEAGRIFEDNLDATMEQFATSPMPEELKPKYRELFAQLAEHVSYTVGEAVREEDGSYTVPVKVKPLTLFSDTYETFRQKAKEYADQVTDSVMDGAELPTDDQMQAQVYEIYYEVLSDGINGGMMYGEVKDVTLHVRKNDRGDYEIDDSDMKELDSLLIADTGEES
ncbi:hypothetical protein H6A65_02330 [Mediterraneibacter glycyrrhizinilyticus]|uniref:hypothetical protein n=1 Tax=Mediterraneibacter glycyrrhizinilyticus TaxID=342942 RepID=UPI00195F5EE3|nr:hypothetical protein [Mediterraneibacter glycyrrhizinilyticus]MBM6750339.1 hypothetical protein [Mediterraneibacter glycyrrhizinilyticus]